MTDHLFEMLMHFFEKSLVHIKNAPSSSASLDNATQTTLDECDDFEFTTQSTDPRDHLAQRVITREEQFRLTKASYQFLMRMTLWSVIDAEIFEQVMTTLVFSQSRIITLQETKWTIRRLLADRMSPSELAFLDLVLYQKEDNMPLH